MKKCLILTSILALTACNGGSGGRNSSYNNETPINPEPEQNSDTSDTNNGLVASVDNSIETINYAVSLGVVPDGATYETVLHKNSKICITLVTEQMQAQQQTN